LEARQALDHQPRSGLHAKKKARDRLIRLAATHPDWVPGYLDETWWSRLSQPALHAWTDDQPLRLVEVPADSTDPDPKALSCYGLLRDDTDQMLLRFVQGRPVSQVTEDFLAWVCQRLAQEGKRALLLIWDNAPWHGSRRVRAWIEAHNRQAKQHGGVRIVACYLPSKSPWLNRIEPKWVHGKKAIIEPERRLSAAEVKERVCRYYGCKQEAPLEQRTEKKVA
jgi:transposase